MDATTTSSSIIDRMIRASRLEAEVYEEVEHDPDATMQAAIIVVGTSILAGIGGFGGGIIGIIVLAALSLVGWAVYAWITYFIGTRLLAGPETSASWSELARTLGYASSPRALLVVASVPILGPLVAAVVQACGGRENRGITVKAFGSGELKKIKISGKGVTVGPLL